MVLEGREKRSKVVFRKGQDDAWGKPKKNSEEVFLRVVTSRGAPDWELRHDFAVEKKKPAYLWGRTGQKPGVASIP